MYGICVDCDPNNQIFETIDAVNTTDDGKNPPVRRLTSRLSALIQSHNVQVVLFSATWPKADVHEVIIANRPDPRFENRSQITLDRLELTVDDDCSYPSVLWHPWY